MSPFDALHALLRNLPFGIDAIDRVNSVYLAWQRHRRLEDALLRQQRNTPPRNLAPTDQETPRKNVAVQVHLTPKPVEHRRPNARVMGTIKQRTSTPGK